MSDEHTTPTPNTLPCPMCADGSTLAPGASCPECGRGGASPLGSPRRRDLRRRAESRRLDGPVWVGVGAVLLGGVLIASLIAYSEAPGVLIPLAILLVPALFRMSRLFRGSENVGAISLLALFLAASGVSLLTALAAGAACFGVCLATLVGSNGELEMGFVVGGVTALIVFVWLSVVLWPRAGPSAPDPGED